MSHFFHSWCLASSYVNGTYVGGLFVLGGGACARVAASRQGGRQRTVLLYLLNDGCFTVVRL